MRELPAHRTSPRVSSRGPGSQLTVPGGVWQVARARSILVVLEGELELHQRGIDRADRFHAMATEVVRGTLQMQPGGLERAGRRHDLRVWLMRDVGSKAGRIARLCGGERQSEDGSERGHADD